MRRILAIVLMFAAIAAKAEIVSDETISAAAEKWLSSDRIAQATMKGLKVATVQRRGALRIVSLSPRGYIVFSSSDVVEPVISFSGNDFTEPREGSPFFDMLAHSDSDIVSREAKGGVRNAKWIDIVGGRDGTVQTRRNLLGASEEPTTIIIEPFMPMHWNQGQPWNDFSPIWDSSDEDHRCPCGCVATATAQQIAYCRWPYRVGRADTWVHSLDADGEEEDDGRYAESEYVVRFDGHQPFDWDAMLDDYDGYWGDARERKKESERFHVARFVSWICVVTKMNFGKNGSGANFGNTGDSTSDWYEPWEIVDFDKENPEGLAKVIADFEFGVPVHFGVPGHSVIGHGLASDGQNTYIYLNYGWGGSADGWYKLYDSPIGGAFPGFRPKKMVQLEPLPKVCDDGFEVKWHLPPCHDNKVEGFEVECLIPGDEVETLISDFSGGDGEASDTSRIYTTRKSDINNETDVLEWQELGGGTYQFNGGGILTSTSFLQYKMLSSSRGGKVEIQASFDGGDWENIHVPALHRDVECYEWMTHRIFLGDHAGQSMTMRIRVTSSWGDLLLFDDFVLSDIIPYNRRKVNVPANARSYTINGISGGKSVAVAVRPIFPSRDGILSDYETTRVSGMTREAAPGMAISTELVDLVYDKSSVGDDWCITKYAEDDTTIKGVNIWCGAFSVNLNGKITADSVLSFDWFNHGLYNTEIGAIDTLTATFADDSGDYTVFYSITNTVWLSNTNRVGVSLSPFAGKSGTIIVIFRHYASQYTGDDCVVRFYHPKVTKIEKAVYSSKREWTNREYVSLGAPVFLSVKGRDGTEIDEGFYRECHTGEDALQVICSQTVTNLCAHPSHLTLMDDSDVSIVSLGNGNFTVRLNGANVPKRSRMMLTLAATDLNGTTSYRDLSLRFDDIAAIDKLDRWRALKLHAGECFLNYKFEDSTQNSGTNEFWIGGGAVSYVDSPFGRAIHHDREDGPWTSAELAYPEEWTIMTMAKTCETNNATLFMSGACWGEDCGFAVASGGKDIVTLSYWNPGQKHVDLLSVSVPAASEIYHAYAIRARGTQISFFVDGVLSGETRFPAMPVRGLQFFSVLGGSGGTGLEYCSGECVDDWRMYERALPDAAIAHYAETLFLFDEERISVNRVLETIAAIGEISLVEESRARLRAARSAYEALTAAQKKLVANYPVLLSAESECARLESAISVRYRVTFGKNGGTGGDDYVTCTEGLPMPVPRRAPKRAGYVFGGYWDTVKDGGTAYYDGAMNSAHPWNKRSSATLWAKWTPNRYKVTFGKNGGTGGDDYVTATYDSAMPSPRTAPKMAGYVFDGYWDTTKEGGKQYYDSSMKSVRNWDKTSAATLWAKWRKATVVKVTFGKNGGTGGDNYVTCTTGKPMPTPRTAPTKSGWTFGGYWDTLACDAKGNPLGKQYYNSKMESVRNWDKTSAVTLWAKWTVRVTLGKNGGTGGDSYVTVIYNQPFPTRAMPTKSGYTFGGYFVSASSKTGQCYNADGTGTSTMKWTTGGTPTIWALWNKTGSNVVLPVAATTSAAATPVVAESAGPIPAGLYSGVLGDGSGAFWLMLDEPEEGYDRTAYLYVASEDGALTAECTVEESDGILVLTTEDGETFAVDLTAGVGCRL